MKRAKKIFLKNFKIKIQSQNKTSLNQKCRNIIKSIITILIFPNISDNLCYVCYAQNMIMAKQLIYDQINRPRLCTKQAKTTNNSRPYQHPHLAQFS